MLSDPFACLCSTVASDFKHINREREIKSFYVHCVAQGSHSLELKVSRPAGAHSAPRKRLLESAHSTSRLPHAVTRTHPQSLLLHDHLIRLSVEANVLSLWLLWWVGGSGGSLFVFLCASVLSWSHWKSPLIAIIHPHAEISLNFSYPLPTNSPTKHTKQPRSVAVFLWFTEDLQQCHNHINILAYASRTIWWILSTAVDLWHAAEVWESNMFLNPLFSIIYHS